jgi:1,4-dihydroxy-2-naphthoate octaprenyltransferase
MSDVPEVPPAAPVVATASEMPSVSARPSGVRVWWLAIRPATLPASTSGVVVGIGVALAVGAAFRADTAAACLAVALLLQILSNLANDLSDFRKGADTPDRAGPTRVAAAGFATERQMEIAIALVIGVAGLIGLWLVTVGGPAMLVLGLLAVISALAYTGGPLPYGYRGLGEVFVFVFFGLVAVAGTAYLQALRFEAVFLLAAVPVGALTTAILVVNNLRDIPTDRAAGKITLAVRFGSEWTAGEWVALVTVAYLVPLGLLAAGYGVLQLLPLLTLPLAAPLLRTIHGFREPRELNAVLRGTARLSLAFGVTFAVALGFRGWPA